MAEETRPFLAFRSDSAVLREIISQYGWILKQYGGHFADPARPSISLPRVVEEEDDEENMSFTRKYEMQNKDDQNILYINKHATNSNIVRAWLMSTNDTTYNNNNTNNNNDNNNNSNNELMESDTQKSGIQCCAQLNIVIILN